MPSVVEKIKIPESLASDHRFIDDGVQHSHQLFRDGEWKNLCGISSIVKDITTFSIPAYYGSRRALMKLGFDPKVDRKKKGETERQNKEAQEVIERFRLLSQKEAKKLLLDAYKAHAEYSTQRAEKGTTSHDIIDKWIKECIATNDGYPIETKEPKVQEFMRMTKHLNPRFIASEKLGYNEELWIGGKTDIIVDTNIGLGIWDNKDREAIYDKDLIQFGGYTCLFPFSFTHVMGIPLEGEEPRIFYDVPQLQEVFKHQLGVYKFMQSFKPKKIK